VMGTMDVRDAENQPTDFNWKMVGLGGTLPAYHHPDWIGGGLGEIFGIAIEINGSPSDGDIFVTSTTVYAGPTSTTNYPSSTIPALVFQTESLSSGAHFVTLSTASGADTRTFHVLH
jgi:hypothetical protein